MSISYVDIGKTLKKSSCKGDNTCNCGCLVSREIPPLILGFLRRFLCLIPHYQTSSIKLCHWSQKWHHPGDGHMFHIGLYRENMKNFLV